jgi:enoyl-CoA hydratase/carnithine racemase
MPARSGHVRAFAMFALGEVIDGAGAVALGLANAVVPAAELHARARAAALALSKRPLGALAATKRLMRDAALIGGQMEREGVIFQERLKSAEAREAFAAFAERRQPDFSKLAG